MKIIWIMKRVSGLLFILLVISGFTYSQQKAPAISFKEEVYDFGTIKEEDGSVTCTFEFTNTGNEPLIINNVKASCGCTTPDWTKTPVAPGKKGYVKATYNPKNRPGKFNKTITVMSNAETPAKVLRIQGEVTPSPKTVYDLYPQQMGDLRLKSNHISFMTIKNTEVKTNELEIMNDGDTAISITFINVPKHITLKVEPQVLQPKEKGKIIATYNAKEKNDWGFVTDRVNLKINNNNDPRYRLSISATIEEDFSALTPEQLANAPVIEFDNKTFDFGTINQGESVTHDFTFTNNGKSDLKIRKIKASCGCTATIAEDETIPPGKSSKITATFNSRGKRNKQNKTITVITNDPVNHTTILRITGNVLVPTGQ
ncbi:MAG: DUF1573 domain-containing protein [Marinilabiliales bacterium]